MDAFVQFLSDQPLVVLFVVIGTGYFFGSIPLFGFSLGPAAVLFSGIAVGALDTRLRIPEFISVLGLILSSAESITVEQCRWSTAAQFFTTATP
jgi:uncharacterized transporter YbjL